MHDQPVPSQCSILTAPWNYARCKDPPWGIGFIPGGQVLDLDRLTALTMGKNPWVVDIREETQVVLFSHGTVV